MSEDAASSSSSAHSRDHIDSRAWSSTQSVGRGPRCSVVRTTEKSVVFRMRTQEKLASNRGGKTSKQTLHLTQSEGRSGTDDNDIHETLMELYAAAGRKKKLLNSEEETFRRGQERLSSLQREHAELLHNLEQCKRRRKERLRIQKMLRGPEAENGDYERERSIASDSGSDSDYNSHHHRSSSGSSSYRHRPRRDGAKKERKRLRRFQSDVSLRFQLLQSECRRSDMEVDKLKADLRREYADACLFGNSLNF
ncbi:hypothetical protein JG687_00000099 [Phytophthora cactorum]|uniref:Uncharacterized protein n=1 Tax=Phytophthora cactorum TaxID=29920 RepID=A0A8T1V1I3_9STRA|nr:hypothetical protein PC120_g741 [Phytophthora cactorum]KAG3100815.1 hypothetical protein PC121_g1585 [Phytophthora cactorum]KAG3204410.1 hypothetical protein PC128_g1902 [Phytophthora cactorum]KAG4063914.1 hypothetical protein PC123_g1286 [Phytophthora cactorum]KAG6974899.1 hypothetical protein JG687_00000099 [Phytophthora cactorum]